MLHTLTCSPWRCDINTLLHMLDVGDDLLLIQDGVLAAVHGNYFIKMFINVPCDVFALQEDIRARGLSDQISEKISVINYADFVNLAIKQPNQMNWC